VKKFIFPLLLLLFPLAYGVMQGETPTPRIDITGVTATDLPTATITVEVLDRTGQPITDLTQEDFTLTGELAEFAQIVSVENVRDDNLSFATVLMIDISSSMGGRPFELAQEAAREFINGVGENDPVAIMVFGNDVRLLQDYTTDKAVLLTAIDNLPLGGETNLYEAALVGVQKAAEAPTVRRAMILLSDGAHYLRSTSTTTPREGGLEASQLQGVPVYTIGLGYGTDRTYLTALSEGSNGRFYESPTPEQLVTIFGDLAALFRSLYIITLNVDVPLDGTEYDFALTANTSGGGTNEDTGVLRAPIPVPLVEIIPQEFDSPLNAPVEFTASVISDEQANGLFELTGEALPDVVVGLEASVPSAQEPTIPLTYTQTFPLDPFTYPPGSYTLTYTATDESGDVSTASVDFQVAAIPAVINSVSPDLTGLGPIGEPTTVTLDVSEQTATTGVVFSVDGETIAEDSEAPFEFTIDPTLYTPGEPHTLTAEVTSESGAVATTERTFTVAAFAPEITVNGIEANELIESPRAITVEASGQTPATQATFAVDGTPVLTDNEAPFEFTLEPFSYDASVPHVLTVTVTNEGGQSSSVEVSFRVIAPSPTPTLTPTSTFTPTFTPTPTIDFPATGAAATALVQTTLDAQATSDTRSTSTAEVRATANAASTLEAVETATAEQAAANVASTATADVENTTATMEAQETATAEQDALNVGQTATADADNATVEARETATIAALDTATAEGNALNVGQTATADADNATVEAQETESGRLTATAEQDAANVGLTATVDADNAMVEVQETESGRLTATAEQDALNVGLTATADADNATVEAQETESGRLTATAEQDALNVGQTATADADNATVEAQETESGRLTATAEQGVANDGLTATVDAQVTLQVRQTGTAEQSAALRVATRSARETASAVPTATPSFTLTLTPTIEPTATLTPTPEPTDTVTVQPSDTLEPTTQPTDTEEPTAAATDTSEPTVEATDTTEPPTQVAQIEPTPFDPTVTPVSPTEITAPGGDDQSNTIALLAIACGVILLAAVLLFILFGRRRR
jgi:hypothetical protein